MLYKYLKNIFFKPQKKVVFLLILIPWFSPCPLAYLMHEFNISSTKHVHLRAADERVYHPPPPG
jgi:hypothetical protein